MTTERRALTVSASSICLLISIVLVVLKAFGVQFGPADIGWIGIAFLGAGLLLP